MGTMDYFPCFFKYRRSLDGLTDEQVGRVFRAAMQYAEDGAVPPLGAVERMAFAFIKADIDVAQQKYADRCEKNRTNVKARWDKPEEEEEREDTNEYERIQTNTIATKQTNKQTDKQTNNSGESTRARARGGKNDANGGEGGNGFAAPDAETVRQYCEEAGITVDAERFVEHYGSLGWRKGGQQIRDWKALCRKWACEDREKAAADAGKTDPGFSSFDADEYLITALKRTYGDA